MDSSEHSALRLAAGASASRLSRNTEPVGFVAGGLRRQRLANAHGILANNSDRRTISSSRMLNVSPETARKRGRQGSRCPAWLSIDEAIKLPDRLPINIRLGRSLASKR
ncbi:hypothetical protein BSY16_4008 (plasmid) [Sinorhizobium sp. RAC02]|nr:hypothetical protein BSY16_4008 [Sinorhizobium sp. RAC02]